MTKENTMPKTTMPTREDLEAQAAELQAKLDAIRQAEQQATDEAHARAEAAREQFDRDQLASFDLRALDAECGQAEVTLRETLLRDPLIVALTDYVTTLRRRRLAVYDAHTLRQRLHPEKQTALNPPQAEVPNIGELLAGLVERAVQHRIEDERAEVDLAREAAAHVAAQRV
jgi:hypothetical protein